MKVAVFGCLHGELNEMFKTVEEHERNTGEQVELILVCGDCQTIRHRDDLRCIAVPNKYKRLGDFHDYYSGHKKVPKLTIFVGGNHEASNYLMTLPYGGWVCDNFYYMGFAGVVKYKGLRIGGVSGIFNHHNCNRGRFERMPLDDGAIRSIYHTRRLDVFRLQLLSRNISKQTQLDAFLSHDWPAKIYDHGNLQQLLRYKPFFSSDIQSRHGLGSPLTQPLVYQLKPRRWFAAHLHCKFTAQVEHDKSSGLATNFLSLSKIQKGQHYVEYVDFVPAHINSKQIQVNNRSLDGEISDEIRSQSDYDSDKYQNELYYDEEWLTILRKTNSLEMNSQNNVPCPNVNENNSTQYFPTEHDIQETVDLMNKTGGLKIKRNFSMCEPVIYGRADGGPDSIDEYRTKYFSNPQHVELCQRLEIVDRAVDYHNRPSTSNSSQSSDNHNQRNHQRKFPDARSEPFPAYINQKLAPAGWDPKDFEQDCEHVNKKHIVELDEDGCLPYCVDKTGD